MLRQILANAVAPSITLTTGRMYMYQAPWIAVFPGLAIAIFVLGVTMLGDCLRDVLDPRLANSRDKPFPSSAEVPGHDNCHVVPEVRVRARLTRCPHSRDVDAITVMSMQDTLGRIAAHYSSGAGQHDFRI